MHNVWDVSVPMLRDWPDGMENESAGPYCVANESTKHVVTVCSDSLYVLGIAREPSLYVP
jgi:hypothetical protein